MNYYGDGSIEDIIHRQPDAAVVDELLAKVPDFAASWHDDGLTLDDFEHYRWSFSSAICLWLDGKNYWRRSLRNGPKHDDIDNRRSIGVSVAERILAAQLMLIWC